MEAGASIETTAPGLIAAVAVVAVHLIWLLPRLPAGVAWAITGLGAALLLLVLPTRVAGLEPVAGLIAATALLAGHAGWELGHRATRLLRAGMTGRAFFGRPNKPPAAEPRLVMSDEPAPVGRESTGPLSIPPDARAVGSLPEPARPPRAGVALADVARTSLGRYRIDRVIGRGSMGVVYLGQDPMLGRQVAIKTMALGREFAGSELEDVKHRFFREAETAGRLQHRDIVTIYDAGEEDDLAYIAMEFLKGYDLQRHVHPEKLLPLPVVLRVGTRVAEALAYAHGRGVIHRDVKPANVMLHLPTGAVKVTDFGIARVSDASRTRTGTVLGTPSFMSPEHLAGRPIDGRSDLYALGAMLYQLVSGQLPLQADSMSRLMHRIANDRPADIRTLRSDVPEALAMLLARALEKDPLARHADGLRMAAELREVELSLARRPREPAAPAAATEVEPDGRFAATVRIVR